MYNTIKLLTERDEGYGVICEWNTSYCSGELSLELQDKEILKEYDDLKDKKDYSVFMNCILQKCDTENRNGRYYPRELLMRENKKYQTLIGEGRAFGESNHPDYAYISLKKDDVSHRVVKSWWEGNTLMGVLEILTSKTYHDTGTICTQGDYIAFLLSKGAKLGISSRGVGSLKNIYGKNTVQSDFELICYDLVSSPSTPGAFLYPESEVKINESVETKITIDSQLTKKLKNFLL
jgi:hypothetical protein